ncbi:MAG: glycosyltransferase [Deltaproteobacteria bacterium]|nr:glycosyltransferase [Deltaproteobacteria bacterium]
MRQRPKSRISVLLLTRNHARYLKRSLGLIVRQARACRAALCAFDTSSSDGSADLLRDAGFRVTVIAPEEFGHGRTRNVAAAAAGGEIVVFLNGDAVPRDAWLKGLLGGFAMHPDVAGVFSRQVPPPGTDPLRRADIEGHPAFGSDIPWVVHLDSGIPADISPAAARALYTFDTVSCAVKTEVIEDAPFPDVAFGEDLLWGKAVLERGRRLVYAPASVVEHCHDLYAHPMDLVRRHFADAMLARKAAGAAAPGPLSFFAFMAGAARRDFARIAESDMDVPSKAAWAAFEPAARTLQFLAIQAGAIGEHLPPAVRDFLSWTRKGA